MSKTITVYTFDELSPKARERAMQSLPEPDCEFTLQECIKSLEALCKVAGVTLKDYELGPDYHCYVNVEIGGSVAGDEPEYLCGPRMFAWIENHIFGPLRHHWTPATVPPSEKWASIHGRYSRRYTKPDRVPACPLTGVCFDEDLLDVFRSRDTRDTLKERFKSLADVIRRICEADLEYQYSEEGRMERAEWEFDGDLFTEEGRKLQ